MYLGVRQCRLQLVTLDSESNSDGSTYSLALTESTIEDTIIVVSHRDTTKIDFRTYSSLRPPNAAIGPPFHQRNLLLLVLFINSSITPNPNPLPHMSEPISKRLRSRKR